jgi:hypothetical protein
MHICPYGAMAIFILNKISLLELKAQNRARSAFISLTGAGLRMSKDYVDTLAKGH